MTSSKRGPPFSDFHLTLSPNGSTSINILATPLRTNSSSIMVSLYVTSTMVSETLKGSIVKIGALLTLGSTTEISSVSATGAKIPSETLMVRVFKPISPAAGVPESAPLPATLNHAGPDTLAKVNGSPLTSFALSERVAPLYAVSSVALVSIKGLVWNHGAAGSTRSSLYRCA